MSYSREDIARLITEDPDVLASTAHQGLAALAGDLGGGDPTSTTNVRKQLEKQKKLQQKEKDEQGKKLDPYFRKLDDAEGELQALQTVMAQQDDQQRQMLGRMGKRVPDIRQATDALRRNLKP